MRPPFRALPFAMLLLVACTESPTPLGERDTLVTSAFGASPPPVDTNYTLVDLGAQDICWCYRFNYDRRLWFTNHGAIAGGEARPFVWDSVTGFTYLPDLGRGPVVIADFNEAEEVAGTVTLPTGLRHAVFWSHGALTDLGTLGGNESVAMALDRNGRVVGWSNIPGGGIHAFLWSGGQMKDLNPPGRGYSVATAAADYGGRVALQVLDSNIVIRAMVWDHGSYIDLGPPPGVPAGMNEDLRVATPLAFTTRGFLLGETRYQDSRNEQMYRAWIWDGTRVQVVPTLIESDRRTAIPVAVDRAGAVAVQEYWYDPLAPSWDTRIWSGGTLEPALTKAYPAGTSAGTIHVWQLDQNGTLVGGVAKPYPVVNGVYAVTLRNGAMKILPDLHGLAANALAINQGRDIAGWARDSATDQTHLVIWRRKHQTATVLADAP